MPNRVFVQHVDRIGKNMGSKVSVFEGCANVRVSEQVLDRFERDTLHHKVTGIGVPKNMPPDVPKPGPF